MDVNGTRFHLLYGVDDWGLCLPAGSDSTLAELWAQPNEALKPDVEWNPGEKVLRLTRQTPLFRPSVYERDPLPLNLRRGAGRDRYGHWYWIDADESGIRFLANGERTLVSFWRAADQAACEVADPAAFHASPPPPPRDLLLRGLAVTTRHYLVVGSVTDHGILIFDLHRGGPPLLLLWPEEVAFTPWDMAPTPDGGVLILDAEHGRYWRLDDRFRLFATVTETEPLFHPPHGAEIARGSARTVECVDTDSAPEGFDLVIDGQGPAHPISIESGPDANVLILDAPPDTSSQVFEYFYDENGIRQVHVYALEIILAEGEDGSDGEIVEVSAHDFAYVAYGPGLPASTLPPGASCGGLPALMAQQEGIAHVLFVAEHQGNQVIAYEMVRDPLDLEPQPDYLPLRRWAGKALMAADGQVYYDFADRWVPLQVLQECHYAPYTVIVTPMTQFFPLSDHEPPLPGQMLDSAIVGCTWHRLLLDADVPMGTHIGVRARAADDPSLLPYTLWQEQPSLYRRSDGAELPYYDPYAQQRAYATRLQDPALGPLAGTWELLFQNIQGRYLQLELTLEGTGRSTPEIRALRAWYPRFSYLEHYLPAIYREDPVNALFLERWLANVEGFYTHLEDQIEQFALMLDPRTAPAEALEWLACWFGLVLDPLWSEERRRFMILHLHWLYAWRGTIWGLELALRVYLDCTLTDDLFDLSTRGTSRVRIVEQYLLRGVSGAVYGDPTAEAENPSDPGAAAYRFSVLIPHVLTAEEEEMVERIILLEKPAHTAYELKRYWDLFRVGEARLGLDTQIGESVLLNPLVLGDSALADAFLSPGYPHDIDDRIVLDRDPLGDFPPL